jgi:hypothetical protein
LFRSKAPSFFSSCLHCSLCPKIHSYHSHIVRRLVSVWPSATSSRCAVPGHRGSRKLRFRDIRICPYCQSTRTAIIKSQKAPPRPAEKERVESTWSRHRCLVKVDFLLWIVTRDGHEKRLPVRYFFKDFLNDEFVVVVSFIYLWRRERDLSLVGVVVSRVTDLQRI